MFSEFRVFAPCKINIGLRVLPKRQDGFHNLESIFQTVKLSDELIIRQGKVDGKCIVHCDSMILPEKNTITMAYDAFYEATGCEKEGVDVTLVKHIPAGGGLGGGSSDAASFIKALQKIHHVELSSVQLDFIAGKVGSDVFFFTHCDDEGRCCAVVTGRGEYVRVIKKRPDLFIVMVFPEVHSSTKEAYALVDELYDEKVDFDYPELEKLEEMYNSSISEWKFKNTFTEALSLKYPQIYSALKLFGEKKALFADMSGSGSSVFGIYASWEEAENTAKQLKDEGFNCVVTQ